MNANNFVKVTSANGLLQAIDVQTALEAAGIPAKMVMTREGSYIDILVPAGNVYDVESLLAPEPPCGEILVAKK